jgi:DnaJ-class molecular chaperone
MTTKPATVCVRCNAPLTAACCCNLCPPCYDAEWASNHDGREYDDREYVCALCDGEGAVPYDDCTSEECPECGGTGEA